MPDKREYRTAMTPAERSERARLAALTRWAGTADRTAATSVSRAAADRRFYAAADALGITDEIQREMIASSARRAHLSRMRLDAARRRRLAGEADAEASGAA